MYFGAENLMLKQRWYGRIAAIALQYPLTLVTRDEHFGHLENLQIETW